MVENAFALPRGDRFLVAIVVGAVALIVVGLAIVLGAGTPAPRLAADPSSPVGVVQRYVEALRAGDVDGARALLTTAARSEVERNRDAFAPRFLPSRSAGRRILLEPISESADRAEVRATVSTFNGQGGLLDAGTFHQEVLVRLVRENGQWRISQPIEPYPFVG